MSVPDNTPASPVVDEAERVLVVARAVELAQQDQRIHASCGWCYALASLGLGALYIGVCGQPAVIREFVVEYFDLDTGEPHNPCPSCTSVDACAVCGHPVVWA